MKTLLKYLLLLAPIFLVAACGGSDDDADDRLDIADPKVRFIHAIPLGPGVTLYRDTVAQADATGVSYKFASKYFDVATDAAPWRVKTANGALTIGSVDIDAQRGNKYTIMALPGASASNLLLIRDPYNKSIASDNARVRVVNGSFNAAHLDIYLTAPGVDIAALAPTFGAVAYGTAVPASGSDSVEVEGGVYLLRATEAGTKNVVFDATVTLDKNADWLLTTLPETVTPNHIKLLVAKSDDEARTTIEIQD